MFQVEVYWWGVFNFHFDRYIFEPIVFDYAGGLNIEGRRILDSLCKAADEPLGRPPGRTRSLLQERISILLQRHVHVCLERRRTVHRREPEILAENFVLA